MVTVREIMTRKFPSVRPSASMAEMVERIVATAVDVVPVCENGRFRGVVSERDILARIVANVDKPNKERASSLMKSDYPLVSPGDDMACAARIMAANRVRVLPVAQNGRLVGVITLHDLARESLALAALVLARIAEHEAAEPEVKLGD